jgi:hypothetical protein
MSKEMREQINKVKNFGQFLNENKTLSYKDILLKNGYSDNGRWFKKETDDYIHYAWIWKSSNSMKMVGYKKKDEIGVNLNTDEDIYGEKVYFVSPTDEMNVEILQDFITNNVF